MQTVINYIKEFFRVIVTLLVELRLLSEEAALSILS
jgi:hypothetical protein